MWLSQTTLCVSKGRAGLSQSCSLLPCKDNRKGKMAPIVCGWNWGPLSSTFFPLYDFCAYCILEQGRAGYDQHCLPGTCHCGQRLIWQTLRWEKKKKSLSFFKMKKKTESLMTLQVLWTSFSSPNGCLSPSRSSGSPKPDPWLPVMGIPFLLQGASGTFYAF